MKQGKILPSVMLSFSAIWVLAPTYSWSTPEGEGSVVSDTFTVENMTCAACPITVRKAISRVDGVQRVEVNFEGKTVTATYDPARADAATIASASAAIGFPAHVRGHD